ncbi:MAG: uracil-DNA glycosylase family protein [Streptococcaceae bacterium]|jgi:uracil-DNA glycosylase|nr:uracil-DNA glycosylase family protein [Streptococcaceae bacterium]
MTKLDEIFWAIKTDPFNAGFEQAGISPLYLANPEAKVCFIGQAPGRIAQEKKRTWDDSSGDRLREWAGVSREEFYNSDKIAIVAMDFYFPGKGKSGDLPPRKGFAKKWHPLLFEQMPNIELFILIGSYAQRYYLDLKASDKSTEVIKNYKKYLQDDGFFPLVHPSPRNNIWLAKNEWFERDVIPDLKKRVRKALDS